MKKNRTTFSQNIKSLGLAIIGCSLIFPFMQTESEAVPATTPDWEFHGSVAVGDQFDVQASEDGIIHLVAGKYYQFDLKGKKVVQEYGDGQQNLMSFAPAIGVDTSGNAHLFSRHEGSWNSGFQLRYRNVSETGQSLLVTDVGRPIKRNYAVGIASSIEGEAYMVHGSAGDNVWGSLRFYRMRDNRVSYIGYIDGIYRADADTRMRSDKDTIYLISGKPDNDSSVYFSYAGNQSSIVDTLKRNMKSHRNGSGRRGFPDLALDKVGNAHLSYGAYRAVYYNRYDENQRLVFNSDKLLFNNLGGWHINTGLSAIAASDDGKNIVAVALKADGTDTAADSELLWRLSQDGGETWGDVNTFGIKMHAGEGRHRPRIVAVGSTFLLFYTDNSKSGVQLATLMLESAKPTALPGPISILLSN